ncbi:MAG: RNA-binding protein [Hyphomicrobiales bacterium]|nr:RNA-binding protein [Hyphomicrobiales bacterium]MBV8826169.1 RNA-binding protein [Hyphomicrobiales bacterium]MBV9428883.1 RNA-binding protein [Bradyrhizobiaceae bacterium]
MLARNDDAALDAGPRRAPGSERLCIVRREVKPVTDLIRFVMGPDREVVPDLKRRLPGRGVWVTASRTAVAEAVKRRAFGRAFKAEVHAAPDLADVVERLLEQSVLGALSIVRKAGRAAIGFAQVERALAREPVVALVHAAEAGHEGVRKLAAEVRKRGGQKADDFPVVDRFTAAQLDLAFGRANVVHAALLAGPASDGFLARYRNLERFRTIGPGGQEC